MAAAQIAAFREWERSSGAPFVDLRSIEQPALVVNGADRETVTLAPAGENALKGELKKAVVKGAAISVTLKTAAGKSGQARFKM